MNGFYGPRTTAIAVTAAAIMVLLFAIVVTVAGALVRERFGVSRRRACFG
jgi:hypothetical protein